MASGLRIELDLIELLGIVLAGNTCLVTNRATVSSFEKLLSKENTSVRWDCKLLQPHKDHTSATFYRNLLQATFNSITAFLPCPKAADLYFFWQLYPPVMQCSYQLLTVQMYSQVRMATDYIEVVRGPLRAGLTPVKLNSRLTKWRTFSYTIQGPAGYAVNL